MDNRDGEPSAEDLLYRDRVVVAVLIVIIATVAVGVGALSGWLAASSRQKVDTQTRLEELSKSLLTASTSIGEIQTEIDQTKRLVDELEQKKSLYEQLISTNREQVEAIALMLGQRQEQEQRKALWISVSLGILGNMITAVIMLYLEYKVGVFRRWLGPRTA